MQRAQHVETTASQIARTFGPGRSVTGLEFERYFTKDGVDPFDEIDWELRSARHRQRTRRARLRAARRRVPASFWSQQATNIVVSKYFRGQIGTPERERSVKQLIGRVVDTITQLGARAGLLRVRRRPAGVQRRAEAPAGLSEGLVQQPGLVQLRLREGAAVLGLLHQLGAGHDGVDPRRWPRPRACCSSSARARARTCRRSARRARCWPAAARRRARCRS